MSAADRMHEYLMANGGVPPRVGELVELEATIGDKFECREHSDPTIARGLLGLDGRSPSNLPSHERLRLADFLRRAQSISDSELTGLGMIARPIEGLLERVRENIQQNRAAQTSAVEY